MNVFPAHGCQGDARVLSPHSGAGSFAGTPPANLGECDHPADTLGVV